MRDRVGTNRPHHQSHAHMQMLRYLSAQARRVPPGNKEVAAERAALAKHQSGRWPSVNAQHVAQRALEAVGFGGAAHPIRRLHHPGGEMMFPFGGRDFATMARVRASKLANFPRAARSPIQVGRDIIENNDEVGLAVLGGYGALAGATVWDIHKQNQRYANQQRTQKRQVQKADRLLQQERHTFLYELDVTARAGHMTRSDANDAHRWASVPARSMKELRGARDFLHANYKPPRGGWEP